VQLAFKGQNICSSPCTYLGGQSMLYRIMIMLNLTYPFDHIFFMSMTNVFSSIFSCLVIGLKGKWSIRQKRRFHSTPSLNISIVCQRGEEEKGLYFILSIRFWRFMPKGEKVLAQSKRTAPPPQF
jgi:hypothetical protein